MAEPAQSRPGRRLLLSSGQGSDHLKRASESDRFVGFLRDAIDPEKCLLGTIAVTIPAMMVFAMMFGYPDVCWGLFAMLACIIVTLARRRIRRMMTKNRRGDGSGNSE